MVKTVLFNLIFSVLTLLTTSSSVNVHKQSYQKQFRPGHISHYVTYQSQLLDDTTTYLDTSKSTPSDSTIDIVFLPGFGVGTFHYEKNMEKVVKSCLVDKQLNVKCHSLDWLGQSKSWPVDLQASDGLCYDAVNWCEQLEWLLETQIKKPSFLIGNSLGGFIAVQVAARRPDLVKGLILINATPIWSFQPPSKDTTSWRPLGWTAELPAPKFLSMLGHTVFKQMRNEDNIKRMLSEVYEDSTTIDEELIRNIQLASSNPLGPDAFTSIMFAPKMDKSFEDQLVDLSPYIPVLLLYGAQDPWVTPFWGDRAYRRLIHRTSAAGTNNRGGSTSEISGETVTHEMPSSAIDDHMNIHTATNLSDMATTTTTAPQSAVTKKISKMNTVHYYLSPAGHCPHHEVSGIVNQVITDFVAAYNSSDDMNNNNNSNAGSNSDTNAVNNKFSVSPTAKRASIDPTKLQSEYKWRASDTKTVTAKQSFGLYDEGILTKLALMIDDYKV